jgi:hypothetical protein
MAITAFQQPHCITIQKKHMGYKIESFTQNINSNLVFLPLAVTSVTTPKWMNISQAVIKVPAIALTGSFFARPFAGF